MKETEGGERSCSVDIFLIGLAQRWDGGVAGEIFAHTGQVERADASPPDS